MDRLYPVWVSLAACAGVPSAPAAAPVPVAQPPPAAPAPALDERCASAACDCIQGDCMPAFDGQILEIPDAMRERMEGVTWRPGCPVGLDDLSLVRVSRWDLQGDPAVGQIIVARTVAADVISAFRDLYRARFPVVRMEPMHTFDGDDDRSMSADNTSGFNCRPISGGTSFSRHSWGTAIDLNPIRNPFVKRGRVLPPEGVAWLEREGRGVVTDPGPALDAFRAIGWRWGGHWNSAKDYQHFSTDGR